jgi:hypothetical protein
MLIRLKSKYFVKLGAHEAILVGLFKSDKIKLFWYCLILILSDIDIYQFWYCLVKIGWPKSLTNETAHACKDFINLLKLQHYHTNSKACIHVVCFSYVRTHTEKLKFVKRDFLLNLKRGVKQLKTYYYSFILHDNVYKRTYPYQLKHHECWMTICGRALKSLFQICSDCTRNKSNVLYNNGNHSPLSWLTRKLMLF